MSNLIKKMATILNASDILNAADTICMNCIENTSEHPEICETCPVRKLCIHLEEITIEEKGTWVSEENNYRCSECDEIYKEEYNFCPNCGMEMIKNN